MGDESAVAEARAGRGGAGRIAWTALRGVLVGIASVAAGWGAAKGVVTLGESNEPEVCDSDLACLPDLGPLLFGVVVGLLVVAFVAGPLMAWALRLPSPGMYAVFPMFALVLAFVVSRLDAGFLPPFLRGVLPIVVFLTPYAVAASLARRPLAEISS